MVYPMRGNLVDIKLPDHTCHSELPKLPWYRRGKQWAGYIVECSCGKRFLWEQQWSWGDYLGWGWSEHD